MITSEKKSWSSGYNQPAGSLKSLTTLVNDSQAKVILGEQTQGTFGDTGCKGSKHDVRSIIISGRAQKC